MEDESDSSLEWIILKTEEIKYPTIAAVSVTLILLFSAVFLCLLLWWKTVELRVLPNSIAWSFMLKVWQPWRWDYVNVNGRRGEGYYICQFVKGSRDWKRVLKLWKSMDPHNKLPHTSIIQIMAVYNPKLVQSFISNWYKTSIRSNTEIFGKMNYPDPKELRESIRDSYIAMADKHRWNSTEKYQRAPIIPMAHGSEISSALSICQSGFAVISATDSGWYGKGIYFTSSIPYASKYALSSLWSKVESKKFSDKEKLQFSQEKYKEANLPVEAETKTLLKKNKKKLRGEPQIDKPLGSIILSWIVPGRIYPVIEDPRIQNNTIYGRSCTPTYASHYVKTTKGGFPNTRGAYDELVVFQEAQILPAFIITVDTKALHPCGSEFWEASEAEKSDPIEYTPLVSLADLRSDESHFSDLIDGSD